MNDEYMHDDYDGVEAEQAVLGTMLIDPRCIYEVVEKLRPMDFYLRQNKGDPRKLCVKRE